ncbi:energy transducer TonB [Lacinutrix neustonica]|uniref:Energy transducer TonB n=1 Tax=Lacinutrix neustonica TaxID=2980107 RepID=A0A9E8MY59_9FLAO|nr:energy transducer TonB [Lacinutrix neustonica]WAC03713.1 energy transducer TonB [Lacinutrix neustonica]
MINGRAEKSSTKESEYKAVDNDTEAEKFVEKIIAPVTNQNVSNEPFDEHSLVVIAPEEPINIMAVQKVPVYPGCEDATNNEARRKCMSDKLSKHIQKTFDSGLGAQLGLEGRQKILVKFKITKAGKVEILNTRSPHDKLDKEAIRVVEKLPTMLPGMNDDKPVEVSYMLPINLNILN